MHLLDTSVWLGLAFKRHKHHGSAVAWFRSLRQTRCFCRLTQMGFLRLASTPQAMGSAAVTLPQAWQAYYALFADPHVAYLEEPAGIELVWRPPTDSSVSSSESGSALASASAQHSRFSSHARYHQQVHGQVEHVLANRLPGFVEQFAGIERIGEFSQ